MKTFELKGTVRTDLGKKATKQLRREEKVPCVLYGGEENVHFVAEKEAFRKLIYTPNVYIVSLDVDGKTCSAILQDTQFHPVSDELLHADFLMVSEDKPVVFGIPVKLNGLAEGVKQGGKLMLKTRKLRVRGNYTQFPDTLDIDITNLGLGKSIQIGELDFENLEIIDPKNLVVATVKLTRSAISAAAAAKEA